jgi:hypothetical protein
MAFMHSTLATKAMRELNWKPGQSAELSVLGEGAGAGPAGHPVCIREFLGKRMRLAADLRVKGGAAVCLEWDGQLLLGQVLTTEPGGFWMEVHHVLLDAGGLSWQKNGWQRG